jgi:hypothetical protein
MSAPSQTQTRVTFAAGVADANSGLPQVSVLTFKKQKDILKKRREALLAGKGRSYPAIGTHRRSITKHTWTYGELAELTATFMTHYNLKPLWKIAEEIHASFVVQLTHQQALDAAAALATADPQEEQVAQLREPRTHLPTVTAIELKLMDCVSLHFNDTHNYISKPSQIHAEVWSHLLRAQKHRTMIRSMTTAKPEQQQQPTEDQAEDREIWNVHASEFMYETVAEYEAAFPPAKRRKFNPEDADATDAAETTTVTGEIEMGDGDDTASNGGTLVMTEICDALDEIADQIDEREQNRQRTFTAVNASLAQIQCREQQIAQLLTALRDATTEIETHRQEIASEMERIRAIVDPAPPTYSAPVTTTPTSAAANSHVDPNDQFDPDHYECRECSQMFDPLVPGYWLIGPNRETGDTFYLCHECTRFMEDTQQTPATPRAPATPTQRIDEEEDYSYDSEDYQDDEDEPRQGDYDHSDECS